MRALMTWVVAGLVLLCFTEAKAAPSAEALELSRRYVASMELKGALGRMVDLALESAQIRARAGHRKEIPDSFRDALREASLEALDVHYRTIEAKMIPALAEIYTVEELRALVTFYESPVGRSVHAKMPEANAAVNTAMKDITSVLVGDIAKRACQKIPCAPVGGKTGKPQKS